MEIQWQNDKIKKQLQDGNFLIREYGQKVAQNIAQRIVELSQAPSYAKLPKAVNPHPIKEGKKFLYFAVDLPDKGGGRGKWRLTFRPYGEHDMAHVETITAVVICGVVNYHK